MKEVAILLLLAVMVNGCGSSSAVQTPSGSVWQSAMSGGVGTSSGFSFNTQFTVSSNGALSISTFQFLNPRTTCFGTVGPTPTGTLNVTFNSADQVTWHVFVHDTLGERRHCHSYKHVSDRDGEYQQLQHAQWRHHRWHLGAGPWQWQQLRGRERHVHNDADRHLKHSWFQNQSLR